MGRARAVGRADAARRCAPSTPRRTRATSIGFLRLLRELTLRCADAPPAALDVALAEIFDALAHYFPIEFSPPPGDPHGVTQPHIVQAYIRALKASAKFAPRVLPWLLDKLADDDQPGAILQALQALALLAPAYGAAAVAPHAQRLSLGLARRVTQLAGIAPDSPLTAAAVGDHARRGAAAGDAQFQIVAAPVDAALAEPPASAGADRAASVLRALLRTAAPSWSSVRSPRCPRASPTAAARTRCAPTASRRCSRCSGP